MRIFVIILMIPMYLRLVKMRSGLLLLMCCSTKELKAEPNIGVGEPSLGQLEFLKAVMHSSVFAYLLAFSYLRFPRKVVLMVELCQQRDVNLLQRTGGLWVEDEESWWALTHSENNRCLFNHMAPR